MSVTQTCARFALRRDCLPGRVNEPALFAEIALTMRSPVMPLFVAFASALLRSMRIWVAALIGYLPGPAVVGVWPMLLLKRGNGTASLSETTASRSRFARTSFLPRRNLQSIAPTL